MFTERLQSNLVAISWSAFSSGTVTNRTSCEEPLEANQTFACISYIAGSSRVGPKSDTQKFGQPPLLLMFKNWRKEGDSRTPGLLSHSLLPVLI